ncbi:TetR family transcriptional regulator [Stella humosa]|uniref:TetR family transcriptional regulator n=1 Tax=Stella humosa TaxID=94 RepID=A0A3N1KUR9_9PROT|nr:WHG domain-containing protein [Stella humosa]ROP84331.1 TetR family transcriptional regulator [Stella humosa]BBK33845.1 TetR family transcriptional regulator [Stella humosa]
MASATKATPGKPPGAYHHGSLRQALLQAAEGILERDGIQGLTLRAAAREAGVSHAAPKNHFGDLSGLLSDLAALGFERFRAGMLARLEAAPEPARRAAAIGQGYVEFARTHPGLFQLMFRGERLDMTRPALRTALFAAFAVLSGTVGGEAAAPGERSLTVAQLADIAAAWSLVHGFSMLMLDGRLKPLLAGLPPGSDEMTLLAAVLDRGR